jgi:hypothetical protein
MTPKPIGWIALPACVIAVLISVIGGRTTSPRTAQAAQFQSQAYSRHLETTAQSCQNVINQLIAMQRIAIDNKYSLNAKPLTADDRLIAQEYQLDMSKCPADFQLAMFRFMMTEDTARLHAHTDKTGNSEKILGAVIQEVVAHGFAGKSIQSPAGQNAAITDQQKKDLTKMQGALLDVAQVAAKYGVK